eukprot:TRINITY_DN766_c0_g1_i1.p1 TRINITY_DN766_c0_g1~~TRINITY_DN766_c0_g1_i1.p1  ORF type:complete len:663 (+),score=113.96 TRINITY_DN766_c0_g1_i1:85-2073(+)
MKLIAGITACLALLAVLGAVGAPNASNVSSRESCAADAPNPVHSASQLQHLGSLIVVSQHDMATVDATIANLFGEAGRSACHRRRRRRMACMANQAVGAMASTAGKAWSEVEEVAERAIDVVKQFPKTLNQIADEFKDLAKKAKNLDKAFVYATAAVRSKIEAAVETIGSWAEDFGSLVVGGLKAAWDKIKSFVTCLTGGNIMCSVMLPDMCDCNAGSHVKLNIHGGRTEFKCVVSGTSSPFTLSYGHTSSSSSWKERKNGKFTDIKNSAHRRRSSNRKSERLSFPRRRRQYSTATSVELSYEANVQMEPTITFVAGTQGSELDLAAVLHASLDVDLYSSSWVCDGRLWKSVTSKTVKRLFCLPKVCLLVAMQVAFDLSISFPPLCQQGSIKGRAFVDFPFSFRLELKGSSGVGGTIETKTPTKYAEMDLSSQSFARMTVGIGPKLVIWPMPGVPVTIFPRLVLDASAHVKDYGRMSDTGLKYSGLVEMRSTGTDDLMNSHSVLNSTGESTLSSEDIAFDHGPQPLVESEELLQQASGAHLLSEANASLGTSSCAQMNLEGHLIIYPRGVPAHFDLNLGSFMKDAVKEGIDMAVNALIGQFARVTNCVPGLSKVTDFFQDAIAEAASQLSAMVPDVNLDFGEVKTVIHRKPFSKTVMKTKGC